MSMRGLVADCTQPEHLTKAQAHRSVGKPPQVLVIIVNLEEFSRLKKPFIKWPLKWWSEILCHRALPVAIVCFRNAKTTNLTNSSHHADCYEIINARKSTQCEEQPTMLMTWKKGGRFGRVRQHKKKISQSFSCEIIWKVIPLVCNMHFGRMGTS